MTNTRDVSTAIYSCNKPLCRLQLHTDHCTYRVCGGHTQRIEHGGGGRSSGRYIDYGKRIYHGLHHVSVALHHHAPVRSVTIHVLSTVHLLDATRDSFTC